MATTPANDASGGAPPPTEHDPAPRHRDRHDPAGREHGDTGQARDTGRERGDNGRVVADRADTVRHPDGPGPADLDRAAPTYPDEHPEPATQPQAPLPHAPTPPEVAPPITRTRVSGTWVAVIVAAIVLIFLLVFILQNLTTVTVNFLGFGGSLPLGVAMLFAAIAGAILVALVGTARILQLRRFARRVGSHPR